MVSIGTTATTATATTLLSEIALALHPILIKQIGVNLPTQLLARLGSYSILGTALSGPKDREASWGSLSAASSSILQGLMNLIHIGSSQISQKHLPAGSALALFQTYPFFNILAGILFLGDSFQQVLLPLFAFAFVGVLLIAWSTKEENDSDQKNQKDNNTASKKNVPLGIAMALLSALTETLIFLIAKSGSEPSPWQTILKLYPAALGGLLVYLGVSKAPIDTSFTNWWPLILFNVFVGFLGQSLRFWSIPRLPTAIFSLLTFVGVAAGYGWGLLYAKEIPSTGALAGAGLITGALGVLRVVKP